MKSYATLSLTTFLSRKVMQLCTWQLFHLKSSYQRKLCLNFSNLKFKFLKCPQKEKNQNESCRSQKLCNFLVDNFFIWNHFVKEIMFEFLKFEIWIFKMSSNGEMAKTKVVDLKKLCNFVVDNFFIWNHLVKENYVWISPIWNLNF